MLFAGIDLGTSGCRIIVIDSNQTIQYEKQTRYSNIAEQTPELWWESVSTLLLELPNKINKQLVALSIDGTSGTLLLTDKLGKPTSPALMYNDNRATEQAARIKSIGSKNSGAHGTGSSLSKLLYLLDKYPNEQHAHALHQADWISNKLLGKFGYSDENNCLKLGYDSVLNQWPAWMEKLNFPFKLLPSVCPAGKILGVVSNKISKQLELPNNLAIVAGTTDSIAAFIATGASQVGEAVTSLGSTLAVKVISKRPVFSPELGVYSHHLGNLWLAGGASNSGGATLLKYFSSQQLHDMTPELNPNELLNLNYYPLPNIGERFPIADSKMKPNLEPRPRSNVQFFQAILEGIATVERQAYQTLEKLGAPYPYCIYSTGGGSLNTQWTQIRKLIIDAKITNSKYNSEAAYGVALLAKKAMLE